MRIRLARHLALWLLLSTTIASAQPAPRRPAAAAAASTAPASRPAVAPSSQPLAPPKLHCLVINEASSSVPGTEITVHTMGAAGWVPTDGDTTGKGGACDLRFPGDAPCLLMLKIAAPGYQDAQVFYLPDPAQVIPWLAITLKGAKQLSGTVVTEDEEPVADAVVTIDTPAGERQVRTDSQGQFVFKDMMPVRVTVRVEIPGVGAASYKIDLARQNEPMRIVLQPQRRVVLRVIDADSNPVPNLTVQILAPRKAEGRTDADGRMPIPGIGANAARVRVSLDDKFYCLDEPIVTLDVEEGDEPVELELVAARGGRVTGQVLETLEGGEDQGIPAASVWLVEDGRVGRNVTTDEDGKFELNAVRADSYVVAAGHPTYSTALARARVQEGRQIQLRFVLDYGATIRGTVVDASGSPADRAIVRVLAWYPEAPAGLTEGGEFGAIQLPWRATRADAKGEYELAHLPPGRIEIEAAVQDGTGRTTVSLQVAPGQKVVEFRIAVGSNEPKPPI